MKKAAVFIMILIVLIAAAYFFRAPLQRVVFEKILNATTREFFTGSLRLKSASLDRQGRVHVRQATGTLTTEGGPVAIEMASLETEPIFPDLFLPQGSVVTFTGLRPHGSQNAGIKGRTEVRAGKEWSYQAFLNIEELNLDEVHWLNPDNLEGSAGLLKGTFKIHANVSDPEPQFEAVLLADRGGTLQARFFEVLLPYLPALPTKQKMEELASAGKLVKFREAALRIETAAANRVKVALHISIPDYNVELNINLEIRIEEETSFMELIQTLGVIRAKP